MWTRTSGALVAVLAISSAAAQTETNRSIEAAAGRPVRLGVYGSVKKDCSSQDSPEIRVVTPPANGSLLVRRGKLRTSRIKICPNLEAPVEIVIYRSNRGFSGRDSVKYEVRTASGEVRSHHVRIRVRPGIRTLRPSDRPIDI